MLHICVFKVGNPRMEISYNWLKEFIDFKYNPAELAEIMTNLGLEVERFETVCSIKGGLKGVVTGEVLTCDKHPNADRLSVTTVDVGLSEPLGIVCGAPNVAAGQKVLVALAGTTLYPVKGDPLTLQKTKIRGVESNGMICAEDELGLGTSHAGIMVLDAQTPVGQPAAELFAVEEDSIFEVGLTPNRSDATSHLGVAKDILAYMRVHQKYNGKIKQAPLDPLVLDRKDLLFTVEIKNEEACGRYAGITMRNIKVQESPAWLKNRLKAIGVRPINNIVDISNFVLHEMGQPTHIFDADKVGGSRILVKTLGPKSKFVTLDGVDRTLREKDLMICDGDSKGLCIAGVFGGESSGVTTETSNIFIESAYFNAKWIRSTSMHHQLRTDAALIYEKGADPTLCVSALKRVVYLIKELAGGEIACPLIDVQPEKLEPVKVEVDFATIRNVIGVDLTREQIRDILNAFEITIEQASESSMKLRIPFNKADVTREIDVVEEILRVYGFNNVPLKNTIQYSMTHMDYPSAYYLRNRMGDFLAAQGLQEAMSLSLSQSRLYQEQPAYKDQLVYIHNTSNTHLDIMRPNLIYSALENVQFNLNRQSGTVRLFEFGKAYTRQNEAFHEHECLYIILGGYRTPDHWLSGKELPLNFYDLKSLIHDVLNHLGIGTWEETALGSDHPHLADGLAIQHSDGAIGYYGLVSEQEKARFGLKTDLYYAELDLSKLIKLAGTSKVKVKELSRIPAVRRDLAVVVDRAVTFEQLKQAVYRAEPKAVSQVGLFDVFENAEVLGEGKKSYALDLWIKHADKTLEEKELEPIITKIVKMIENETGGIRR